MSQAGLRGDLDTGTIRPGETRPSAVMLTGIGFVALLTGAIAQRFLAPQVQQVEAEEDAVLAEIRELGQRLERIEQAIAQRQQ